LVLFFLRAEAATAFSAF